MHAFSLAEDPAAAPMLEPVLDHQLVPFRSRPRYFRLVSTKSQAQDYAAGGFHVAVDRGIAGGCKDPWEIHDSGTRAVACQQPYNRANIRQKWATAASAYNAAYDKAALREFPLVAARDALVYANSLASSAYADEGIEPPRDPRTKTLEPVAKARRPWGLIGGATVAAGLLGLGLSTWAGRDATPGRGI